MQLIAGLQRSVFGSADGLTFYTALGASDAEGQRYGIPCAMPLQW
jgi:hypothetical protein